MLHLRTNKCVAAVLFTAVLFSAVNIPFAAQEAQAQEVEDCIAVNSSLNAFTAVGQESTISVSPGNATGGTLEVSTPSWVGSSQTSSTTLTLTVLSNPSSGPYVDGSIIVWARNWQVPNGNGGYKDCQDRSAAVRNDFEENRAGSGTCGITMNISPTTLSPGEDATVILSVSGTTTYPIVPGAGASASVGSIILSLPGSVSPGDIYYGSYTAPDFETIDYANSGGFNINMGGTTTPCNTGQARVAVVRQCPNGYWYANPSDINVGDDTTISAPTGWTGGSFSTGDTNIVSIGSVFGNQATVTGLDDGMAYISGSGWTAANGAINCTLGSGIIVVGAGDPPPPGSAWGVIDAANCVVTAPATDCSTNVVWTTSDVTTARVYRSINSGAETLFSSSLSCAGSSCPNAGMVVGSTYDFNLYDYTSGSLVLLDTVRVIATSTPPSPPGTSPTGDISAADTDPDSAANCVTTPPATTCDVDISWTTSNLPSKAPVFYTVDGGSQQYFDCLTSGSKTASVAVGSTYVFKLYSADTCADTGGASAGDVILLWDDLYGSVPSGWSCVSCSGGDAYYQKFLRASSSATATGGSSTSTHTASVTNTSAQSGSSSYSSGSTQISSSGHTHNWSSLTVSTNNSEPSYKQLKLIKKTNPSTLPANAIAIFDTSVPTGWTRYTTLDSTYLRSGDSNSTGGSGSHTHTITGNSSSSSGTVGAASGANPRPNGFHTHSISTSTASSTNSPSYIDVVFGRINSDGQIPSGMIALFDASPNSYWSVVSGASSSYYQRFLRGSSSFGTTGGSSTHDHAGSVVTTAAASVGNSNVNTAAQFAAGFGHTHDVTISLASDSSLPPYKDIILAKYAGAVLLDTVTVTARTPTPPAAPATAHVYNSSSSVPAPYTTPPCGQVRVTWTTVGGSDGYRLYIYDNGGVLVAPYTEISSGSTDTALLTPPASASYTYKVSSFVSNLESVQTTATNSPIAVEPSCGDPLLVTSTKQVVAIRGASVSSADEAYPIYENDSITFRIALTNTGDTAITQSFNLTDTLENLSEPDGGWNLTCSAECTASEGSYDSDNHVLRIVVSPNSSNTLDTDETWNVQVTAKASPQTSNRSTIFRARNNVIIPFGGGVKSTAPFIVWRSQNTPVIREVY